MKLMKQSYLLAFGLLFLVAIAASAQQTRPANPPPPPPPSNDYIPKRWKELSFPEGGFKILLPGEPKVFDTTQKTTNGDVVMHWVRYNGVISQDVMYLDCPINVEDAGSVKGIFDDMRDGALANAAEGKPQVIYETESRVEGHPGRLLRIEMVDNTVLRIKFVAVRNRVYTLIAGSRKAQAGVMGSEGDYQEIAMAFLNSFQLTK
jgi:hypothetical protein